MSSRVFRSSCYNTTKYGLSYTDGTYSQYNGPAYFPATRSNCADIPAPTEPRRQQAWNAEHMLDASKRLWVDNNFILVSIDLEWYEMSRSKMITEFGLSVLQSASQNVNMNSWAGFKPRTIHLVPQESHHKRNGRFIADNMDNFAFGTTRRLPFNHCRTVINTTIQQLYTKAMAEKSTFYLVGHGLEQDLRILRSQDFIIPSVPILDTEAMSRRDFPTESTALWICLKRLGIETGLLHNAANDARATMELLVNISDPNIRNNLKLDENISPEDRDIWRPTRDPNESRTARKKRTVKQHSAGYWIAQSPESIIEEIMKS